MAIDDLRFCYGFDKHNPEHRKCIMCVSIPNLEKQLRMLKAIQEENDPESIEYAGYEEDIIEIERAIEEAKTRLREAEGIKQGELFG